MSEYKLVGCENPRTGEESVWVAKNRRSMSPDDIVDELTDMQSEIERLRVELHHVRGLLETAVDAHESGHWNSLLNMQQLYLTRAWFEEAAKAGGGA